MNIDQYENICKVTCNKEERNWLSELLSVSVPGAKYSPMFRRKIWDGKKRFFNKLSKTFPVGLLNYVLKNKQQQSISVVDKRTFPVVIDKHITIKLGEDRSYQKEAIEMCLMHKNCIVEAATNAGKTAIFSSIILKLSPLPTLVITHREEILRQICSMIKDVTGITCGVVTSSGIRIKPVTVAMCATLKNRLGVDDDVTEFFNSVQCVIVDEVHHAVSGTISALLASCKAPYRFGFSGTVPAEDTHAGMLVRCWLGGVVYKITNDELITMGVSAKPKICIYEIDTKDVLYGVFNDAKSELDSENKPYTNQDVLKRVYTISMRKGIIQNKERNGKVLEIVKDNKFKSILVIVDSLEHGSLVEKLLTDNYVSSVFIHGSSELRSSALEFFKLGKLKVLISSNILDEGVDISGIEVLVLLAGKKSRRQLLQRIGRGLRRKKTENVVTVYDFMDYGNRYLEKHAKNRLAIYKQEGFEIEFI